MAAVLWRYKMATQASDKEAMVETAMGMRTSQGPGMTYREARHLSYLL